MAYPPSPLVSVVIANWNGCALLRKCLGGLEKQLYDPLEIIVVDNGSDDGSRAMLEKEWQGRVKLIINEENFGYARAINQGIRCSQSRYIATLNNDAVPNPNWIAAMVEAAERDPKIGMVASKILTFDDPDVIDGTGLSLYADGSSRARGRLEADHGQYDERSEALLPSGCAALYRRSMLEEIGLHDEAFFAYCEDTDLGLRARLAGWQCAFASKAVVRHRYSASSGEYSETKAFLVERNRLWVAAKNFPLGRLLLTPLYTLLRYAVHAWAAIRGAGSAGRFAQQRSRRRLVLVLFRAQLAGLRGLPQALRARRKIRVNVPPQEIRRWFREFGMSAWELAFKD